MLTEEHKQLVDSLGFKDSNNSHVLHLGCGDQPNICQNALIDLDNHRITFMVIQRDIAVTSVTYSFNQMSEIMKHWKTVVESSPALLERLVS